MHPFNEYHHVLYSVEPWRGVLEWILEWHYRKKYEFPINNCLFYFIWTTICFIYNTVVV